MFNKSRSSDVSKSVDVCETFYESGSYSSSPGTCSRVASKSVSPIAAAIPTIEMIRQVTAARTRITKGMPKLHLVLEFASSMWSKQRVSS